MCDALRPGKLIPAWQIVQGLNDTDKKYGSARLKDPQERLTHVFLSIVVQFVNELGIHA